MAPSASGVATSSPSFGSISSALVPTVPPSSSTGAVTTVNVEPLPFFEGCTLSPRHAAQSASAASAARIHPTLDLSASPARNSADETTLPSTRISPFILKILPLRSGTTSMMS